MKLLGVIPADWKCLSLGDCAKKIGSGITPKGGHEVYLCSGIPLIRSQNVLNGMFTADGLAHISNNQHELMKSTALQANDILFNITGASIGRCCLFPANMGEANLNQHVCIVRLKAEFSPEFFMNVLNSRIAKKQLHENQAGGGREGLNFKNLKEFKVPSPTMPNKRLLPMSSPAGTVRFD